MKYEEPQNGNPHKLTINQHVFPAKSISRFSRESGLLDVFLLKQEKVISLLPKASIFCAMRAWDQKAEAGLGKKIEDNFQALSDLILAEKIKTIGHFEKELIENFYALWRSRHEFKMQRVVDIKLNAMAGVAHSKDAEERLEKGHVMFFREDGTMPGRFIAGINILRRIDEFRSSVADLQWGIVRSSGGEFIVPDSFKDLLVLPVSPTMAIMADFPNALLSRKQLAQVNREAILRSTEYYFARDLSRCPIV